MRTDNLSDSDTDRREILHDGKFAPNRKLWGSTEKVENSQLQTFLCVIAS